MFEGFTLERIDVGDAELRVRHGGSGPPVLLLHGHPRTHVTWHKVAPVLAEQFTVVCPDLRGYGESSKPPTTPDHAPYSKRAMAGDCAALMQALGHEQFCAAGHDRGTYVAQRLALDHPAMVSRLCLMEGIPIAEALDRCDARFAASWYHWFFFGQTEKPAERFINADPEAWYTATAEHMGQEAFEDYRRAIHDPATVHAMIEDYRAGLGIDRDHDDADRAAGRRISCPLLFVWAARDDMEDLYGDPLAIWRDWADDVRGCSVDCGHHIAEEAPGELAAQLGTFFAASRHHDPGDDRMASEELIRALDSGQEIQLTVTGRKSGREVTFPVWFVRDGGELCLVPVTGTDSSWFKNVLEEPAIRVAAGGAQLTARAAPVTDPARVSEILGMFRAKYGARDVAAYYPKPNAALVVPLS